MGTIDFQQPIVSTSKTNMKLFLIAAVLIASVCAEPESEAKADAKPWLAYSNYGYAGYPYAAGYAAYPYAGVYGAGYKVTLLDTTTWERDPLTPNLMPSH